MLSSLKNEFPKEDNIILSQTLLRGAEYRIDTEKTLALLRITENIIYSLDV